jgi:hypothetical protein
MYLYSMYFIFTCLIVFLGKYRAVIHLMIQISLTKQINYYLPQHILSSSRCSMESVDILPPEKIAFIAYNIGVYESVQEFVGLIKRGKITNSTDVPKVADLLSESTAFYDAIMISELINAMLQHTKNLAIKRVTTTEVSYVMNQLSP